VKAVALILALMPARALACALELVLAVDVSGSVDAREYALQTGGLATAFRSADVAAAVAALDGAILVTVTQWSGSSRQRQTISWHRLSDPDSLARFADAVGGMPRLWRNFSTAIGEALEHAGWVSLTAPEPCRRRVIDVSGDGLSNEGRAPRPVADRLAAAGYTVNGLAVRGAEPGLVAHYAREVIAGPGAFVEVAEGFADYPRAILRKLLREIEQPLAVSRLD